jgi:hypothetical protein
MQGTLFTSDIIKVYNESRTSVVRVDVADSLETDELIET